LNQRYGDDDFRIIVFASKSLSVTEQRYSQLEREALAVLWGCQYFHIYIFVKPVTVLSDNKPLISIFNGMLHRNTRLERWSLKLAPYNATFKHISGATNPDDYLSCHPIAVTHDAIATRTAEKHMNFITASLIPKSMTIPEVQEASARSRNSSSNQGDVSNWTNLKTLAYFKCRGKLAVITDGGKKIIRSCAFPEHCRQNSICPSRPSRSVKTKELIRSKIWFPTINKAVEMAILRCLSCQACAASQKRNQKLCL
jgi:hypothetical protein